VPNPKINDGLTNHQRYRRRHLKQEGARRDAWKKKHPERWKAIQKKANLNCSLGKGASEHFEEQQRLQRGRCAICNEVLPKEAHSDHNHETDQWRGVLCGTCNRGLGYLKDSIKVLSSAIQYLKKWETQ
jgi:hypothetical protein